MQMPDDGIDSMGPALIVPVAERTMATHSYTLRLKCRVALALLGRWWGKDIHTVAPKECGDIR